MEHLFETHLSTGRLVLLFVALAIACGFEFVNGFHDTANAVATVIYTRSLRPWTAVVWSGICNFLGVYLGGIAVALGIIKLLPADLLVAGGSGAGIAMVLALLIAAILWNLGTWYFGLPASSSHTMIGAIVGVGLANSLLPGHSFGSGVNWHKAQEVGLALILSPLVGGLLAGGLVLLSKRLLPFPSLQEPAPADKTPPWPVRALLVSTCSAVSYAHGSNDGQKGVGLIMLILIGILPADFALNRELDTTQVTHAAQAADSLSKGVQAAFGDRPLGASTGGVSAQPSKSTEALEALRAVRVALEGKRSIRELPLEQRWSVRTSIMTADGDIDGLEKTAGDALSKADRKALDDGRAALRGLVDYAPSWILVVVALSLGLGTMIGWKRIVVTVGEKIGKTHLTYAQGASAELVAAFTIFLSSRAGLPVSTTHVLSSGIAGTMLAQRSGLQAATVRNIGAAWVLTMPVAALLSGILFLVFRAIAS